MPPAARGRFLKKLPPGPPQKLLIERPLSNFVDKIKKKHHHQLKTICISFKISL
jgi:hypothetical protein